MSFGFLSYHEIRLHATHSPTFARKTGKLRSESTGTDLLYYGLQETYNKCFFNVPDIPIREAAR